MNKKLKLKILTVPLIVLGIFTLHLSAQNKFETLNDIKINENNIVLTLSGNVKSNIFKISNPPRLVIELSNTEHNIKNKEIKTDHLFIKRIRSGQFQNEPAKSARVVIDLKKMVNYELKNNSNEIVLTLSEQKSSKNEQPNESKTVVKKEAKSVTQDNASDPATAASVVPEKPVMKENTAADTVAPAAPATEAMTTPPAKEVIAEPAKPEPVKEEVKTPEKPAEMPKKVVAVNKVNKKIKPTKTIVKMEPAKEPQEKMSDSKVKLPKTPVTLDFEQADIKDILRILSMKSSVNVIYGDDVKGTVTVHLENVPFDKAFDTILSLAGLVSQEQGENILRVATPQKISEERSQAVAFTKIFALNYAKASEVKSNLDSVRSAEGRRGNISVDERTNSLVVTDTPEGLISAQKLIQQLDMKPQQVLIEAKIVEVVLNDSLDIGIQWQYAGVQTNGANRTTIGSSVADPTSPIGVTVNGIDSGGTGVSFPAAPAGGQAGSIAFGIVANNNYLTGALTALSQKGLSKILSTPKVTTINNKEAKILVGQKVPYSTSQVSNGVTTTSTQFLDVGITLTVTPTINIDNRITLEVHPVVSLYVRADPAGPVIGNREAQTTVIIQNQETIVIGGLISEEDRKIGTQVPLLGDLPIIGHLFRRDYKTKDRTELLVFITPKILD